MSSAVRLDSYYLSGMELIILYLSFGSTVLIPDGSIDYLEGFLRRLIFLESFEELCSESVIVLSENLLIISLNSLPSFTSTTLEVFIVLSGLKLFFLSLSWNIYFN